MPECFFYTRSEGLLEITVVHQPMHLPRFSYFLLQIWLADFV